MLQENSTGEKIKHLRESLNLSQLRFGAKLGVTKSTVLCWENNKREAPPHQLKKISELFSSTENRLAIDIEPSEASPTESTTIGQRIKLIREKNRMTKPEFSRTIGVTTQTAHLWECGKTNINIPRLTKISELFNVSLDWLKDGTGSFGDPFMGERTEFAPVAIHPTAEAESKDDPDRKQLDALYSSLSEYRRGKLFGYLIALCNEELVCHG